MIATKKGSITMDLKKLNCMNYHVQCHTTGDHWFAQCGLRSLYTYSKVSESTFRDICTTLNDKGEITVIDTREEFKGQKLTLTMI